MAGLGQWSEQEICHNSPEIIQRWCSIWLPESTPLYEELWLQLICFGKHFSIFAFCFARNFQIFNFHICTSYLKYKRKFLPNASYVQAPFLWGKKTLEQWACTDLQEILQAIRSILKSKDIPLACWGKPKHPCSWSEWKSKYPIKPGTCCTSCTVPPDWYLIHNYRDPFLGLPSKSKVRDHIKCSDSIWPQDTG